MLKKIGCDNLISTVVSISAILFYGLITGNGISSIRAIVMLSMSIIAVLLGRTYDILSAMCLAIIMIVIENPLVIENSGFLLSFGAILGIGVISPALNNVIKSKSKIIQGLIISISVSLSTLPVILSIYFTVPVWAVFINLIIIPLMPVLMISALAAGMVGIYWIDGGSFISGAAHFCLQFYNNICNYVEGLPFNRLLTGKPDVIKVVIYVMLIAFAVFLSYKKNLKKFCVPIMFMAIVVIIIRQPLDFQVKMIDVGQGDCMLITTESGSSILFDCGSSDVSDVAKYRVEPVLKSLAIGEVDYAYLSHSDTDHINGIIQMISNGEVYIKNIVLPLIKNVNSSDNFKEIIDMAEKNNINIMYMSRGKEMIIDGMKLTCIHPAAQSESESSNSSSAVYKINYLDFSMIVTGDADEAAEKEMILSGMLKAVDVLKIGHHGSKYSSTSDFLYKVKPEIALISCGINNRYGHPSTEAIERINQAGAKIYETPLSGEITIKPGEGNIEIKTFR